ncbi:MAG: hypothetical protein ABIP75_12925 [Pyrinomonadaceae bacterium]
MKRSILILAFAFLLLTSVSVSAQTNSSVYSSTFGPKCKTLESSSEGAGYFRGQCPGIGGYKLIIEEGDIRQNMTVVTPAGKKSDLNLWGVVGSGFSNLGPRIEWRVKGKSLIPVALIVRYNVANAEDSTKGTSWLAVVKITRGETCVTDKIAPGAKQNEEARTAADASASKTCLQPGN